MRRAIHCVIDACIYHGVYRRSRRTRISMTNVTKLLASGFLDEEGFHAWELFVYLWREIGTSSGLDRKEGLVDADTTVRVVLCVQAVLQNFSLIYDGSAGFRTTSKAWTWLTKSYRSARLRLMYHCKLLESWKSANPDFEHQDHQPIGVCILKSNGPGGNSCVTGGKKGILWRSNVEGRLVRSCGRQGACRLIRCFIKFLYISFPVSQQPQCIHRCPISMAIGRHFRLFCLAQQVYTCVSTFASSDLLSFPSFFFFFSFSWLMSKSKAAL